MMLEIEKLTVEFFKSDGRREAFAAVKDLSLGVAEGSFTSLVGESGSGKSVTALSVCRLLRPFSLRGAVSFSLGTGRCEDLLSCPEGELLKIRGGEIGYVFQDPASSLNPLMRVGRQLDEVGLFHLGLSSVEAARRSKTLLGSIQMKDPERVYRSFPHELSGGMKQRVMLAMALIAEPRLLIADEPTTALDVVTEFEIMRLLSSLRREKGLTVFFITHNLPLAAAHSDCIHVLQGGRVVETMQRTAAGFSPMGTYARRLFKAGFLGSAPKSFVEV